MHPITFYVFFLLSIVLRTLQRSSTLCPRTFFKNIGIEPAAMSF